MTSDHWAEVERIFHTALELDAGDREAFLEQACRSDDALGREVRSLLNHAETTGAFLERPALEEEAKDFSQEGPPLLGARDIDGYQILSLEGAGGMGEVYRARDLALRREVALKVLSRSAAGDPADLRRFEEEAQLASSLNHPNIVTIYGVGEQGDLAYISMELVRGRTLREALVDTTPSVREAIDLALQLADALAAAHAAGIVHRDLKPENLMVTPEGFLKVLDFGIAKLQGPSNPVAGSVTGPSPRTAQTEVGKVLGTVGYMSPEQAAGKPAESASDQFAFGAIFYEMLSGRRAFKRGTRAKTLEAVLHEEPEPIESLNAAVTAPLRELLARCLAKNPAARYPDTRELAGRLRQIRDGWERSSSTTRRRAIWLGSAAAIAAAAGLVTWTLRSRDTGLRSLAVLPFTNVLEDGNLDYLCSGITKGLIRGISRLSSLTVKPFSAVSNFKGKQVDPRDAGRQLAADAVVTGTVTQKSGRLVVTAALVGVASGARLWSRTYERAAGDVLSVQDAIASAVVEEGIRLRLSSDDRRQLLRKPTNDPAAYELYLNAVHSFERETEGDYLAARDLLQKAVARDHNFALAYVALASTHSAMAIDGYESPTEAWPEVTRNVRRALDEDQDLPDAHSEAAVALFFSQWDWASAEQEWNRAMQSRGGGIVPDFLSVCALQRWALGKPVEALALVRKARELDPLSPSLIFHEASFLFHVRQLDEAASLFETVIGAEPGDPKAYFGLAEVRRAQGRFDEAIDARRRGYKAIGDDSLTTVFSTAHGAEGYRQVETAEVHMELEALQRRAAAGEYASPLELARAYARLGDRERAFGYLDTAFAERSPGLVFLNVDRAWDPVRDDPRFVAAVHRVGLPAPS